MRRRNHSSPPPQVLLTFWLSVLALAGCHKNTVQGGAVACASVLDCPPGWTCDREQGQCVPLGQDAGVDAARQDAALLDAEPDVRRDGSQRDAEAQDAQTGEPDAEIDEDAGPATCLYVPPVGQFLPHMECWWGQPQEYSRYDDVVMAPVVANVTDDDADGDIDTDDIPDILFVTYDYEHDGCCAVRAVLRAVSGRCSGDSTKLQEHFHIANPPLDNSGGLAVGDVDGDGHPDIVGMRWISGHTTYGTVAFTGVLYDSFAPEGDGADDATWQASPAGPAWQAVDDPTPDGTATYIWTDRPGRQGFTWTYGLSTAAVAMVRVYAVAAASGGDADMAFFLRSGNRVVSTQPVTISSSAGFKEYVGEFPKNPFDNDRQWTDADLANLEFGVERTDDATTVLQVTQVRLVVGHVDLKWVSDYPKGDDAYTAGQPAIADLDRDGIGEVIVGRVVLDGRTGEPKWRGLAGRGINSFMGPISITGDIDLDGRTEVIAGNTVYRADGRVKWVYDYPGHGPEGCRSAYPCDGFNATGNFDSDPEAEIVAVREGEVYFFEHDGTLKAKVTLPWIDCRHNEGGPPTVADFDGDGEPEVGVAAADYYSVIDLDCCASLPDCDATPQGDTTCSDPGILWKVPNEDCTSRITGSSVFDFDGDGSAEVIYNDECHFRIFSGLDGAVLYERPNHSHTRLEYTVIADVDNDGNAEIVFIENGWCAGYCGVCDPTTPIQIWGDSQDRWVPTRRIWNEHAYHITNITEDGRLPPGGEPPNWLTYNNFRQNMPDYNVFAAPDLTVTVRYDKSRCRDGLWVVAKVCNEGDLRVGPGVPVTFYDADTQQPIDCATGTETRHTINPGQCETVRCLWAEAPQSPSTASVRVCVDNESWRCDGPGSNHECHEDNNVATHSEEGCEYTIPE